jgi:hypothetical protein
VPADAVLLIDVENMIGANARPGTLGAKVDALTGRAGGSVPVVAACAGNRITAAGKQALNDRKIKLLTVGDDKDAADKALLDEAEKRARDGCTRFVVASHDSRFARLADLGQLEIIAWANPKIAKKDTARAAAVHQVPRPAAVTAKVQAAKARPAPAPTATAPQVPPPADPGPQSQKARPCLTEVSAAAAGAAVLATGILFGAGTVLGASAALRLLRGPGRAAGT